MKHEYQQAHHNYEFDMGLGFQISARGEGHKEYLIEDTVNNREEGDFRFSTSKSDVDL